MGKFVKFLKECELFSTLTQNQLELVEQICEERVYQPGELVFAENTRSSELYLILQGHIDILVSPELINPEVQITNTPYVIATLWRGQSFGEVALVDEGIRSASARAVEKNTRVLKIPRQPLVELCRTNPELGYQMMLNLALDLALKIRNADLKIRESLLYQTSVREKKPI